TQGRDIVPDPSSPTGYVRLQFDKGGNITGKIPVLHPSALSTARPSLEMEVAFRRFGKQGENPNMMFAPGRLTPKQMDLVREETRHEEALQKLENAKMLANAPLNTYQRFQATEALQGKWTMAMRPIRQMEQAYNLMTSGLSGYNTSPIA